MSISNDYSHTDAELNPQSAARDGGQIEAFLGSTNAIIVYNLFKIVITILFSKTYRGPAWGQELT